MKAKITKTSKSAGKKPLYGATKQPKYQGNVDKKSGKASGPVDTGLDNQSVFQRRS